MVLAGLEISLVSAQSFKYIYYIYIYIRFEPVIFAAAPEKKKAVFIHIVIYTCLHRDIYTHT